MTKYTKELLTQTVKDSISYNEVLRRLGHKSASGSTWQHIKKLITKFDIDTSHFVGLRYNLGKSPTTKKSPEEILINGYSTRAKTYQLKRAMKEVGIEYICNKCDQGPVWNNKTLVLNIDHVDGDWSNNQKENLRFLCPNCHSQTETFGHKNIKKHK